MNYNTQLSCPVCNSNRFILRYEAKYVYSYIIDSNAPGINNKDFFFSFLYDTREQKESTQYIECESCGTQYLCYLNDLSKGIDSTSLNSIVQRENIVSHDYTNANSLT